MRRVATAITNHINIEIVLLYTNVELPHKCPNIRIQFYIKINIILVDEPILVRSILLIEHKTNLKLTAHRS